MFPHEEIYKVSLKVYSHAAMLWHLPFSTFIVSQRKKTHLLKPFSSPPNIKQRGNSHLQALLSPQMLSPSSPRAASPNWR